MIRRFAKLLSWWPTEKALLVACAIGIVAIVVMVSGIAWGIPLAVIGSMSIGQGLGMFAGALFVLSIAADAGKGS